MIEITAALLQAAVLGLTADRAPRWVAPLVETFQAFEINTITRVADFLAQTGHETLSFLLLRELWGPKQVPAQQTYERDFSQPWGPTLRRGDRNFKAYNLGNSQEGDGFRFRGRGLIQTTGRANYVRARKELGTLLGVANVPDFESDPDAVAQERWAALTGGLFWQRHELNALSDREDFVGLTERINGGHNGLADRQERRQHARRALGLV